MSWRFLSFRFFLFVFSVELGRRPAPPNTRIVWRPGSHAAARPTPPEGETATKHPSLPLPREQKKEQPYLGDTVMSSLAAVRLPFLSSV